MRQTPISLAACSNWRYSLSPASSLSGKMWKTVFFSSRKLAKSFTSSDFKRVTPGMTMAFHHERDGVTVDIACRYSISRGREAKDGCRHGKGKGLCESSPSGLTCRPLPQWGGHGFCPGRIFPLFHIFHHARFMIGLFRNMAIRLLGCRIFVSDKLLNHPRIS